MGTAFDDVMAEVTAAEMRRTLGLLPWPAREAQARANLAAYLAAGGLPDPDPRRGWGRSTRGALLALACCQVRGLETIHVAGNGHAVRLVEGLARALGLRVRVVTGDPDRFRGLPGKVLFHKDHHQSRR